MFIEDLIGFITSDTSINNTAEIVAFELPTNFQKDKDWIVFDSTLSQRYGTITNKNVALKYEVKIQTVSQDVEKVIELANMIKELLNSYPNSWNISALLAEDIDPDFEERRGVYFKTLKYTMLY